MWMLIWAGRLAVRRVGEKQYRGKALEGAGGGLGVKSKVMGEIRRDGQCTCDVISSCGL